MVGGIPGLKEWIVNHDPGLVQVPYPDGFRTEDVRFATLMLEGVDGSRITFLPQRGRFVRLTETVDEPARAWTIAELAVLRVP